jgi:hypothetical protein
MSKWRNEWATSKCELALKLSRGESGGSYAEAVLILCAALSALAAEVWPGTGIDRRRFVHLLKRFAPPRLSSTLVSVPILAGYLRKKRKKGALKRLQQAHLNFGHSQVVTGHDVDRTERDIISVCPKLDKREIRDCCYASLLYRELRSAYAHEYRPGKKANAWAITQRDDAQVSYVNWVNDPDRHIHFHVSWLSELVAEVAKALDRLPSRLPARKPKHWWVDG